MGDRWGGIVLCGGKSSRMGRPKAWLPFGDETMLARVVRTLREVVGPIVVVAAEGQELPPLPPDVLLAHDETPDQGPLEGLRIGLERLSGLADVAFATSCDVPLLRSAWIRRLLSELRPEDEIVVPRDERFHHPLAALYRPSILPKIESLLRADQRRPVFLFEQAATRVIPVDRLREIDPELDSLRNLNHPDEYREALVRAGISP